MTWYIIVLLLLCSTAWHLKMLTIAQYQEYSVQLLLQKAQAEYLLSGIERYVKLLLTQKSSVWSGTIAYPIPGQVLQVNICRTDERCSFQVTYQGMTYERLLVQQKCAT